MCVCLFVCTPVFKPVCLSRQSVCEFVVCPRSFHLSAPPSVRPFYIYLSSCTSVRSSACPSVRQPILSVHVSVRLPALLFVRLFSLYVCPFVCLSVLLSVPLSCLYMCPLACLSVRLSCLTRVRSFVCLPFCPSVCPVCTCVRSSVCPSACHVCTCVRSSVCPPLRLRLFVCVSVLFRYSETFLTYIDMNKTKY